jgi:hypothetical protein
MLKADANADAFRALQQIRDGAAADGLDAYIAALRKSDFSLPCGVHAQMLRHAGAVAAESFYHAALCAGGDMRVSSTIGTAAPDRAMAEYMELFEAGAVNALMVLRYLTAASHAGRHDEVALLAAPARVRTRLLLDEQAGLDDSWLAAIAHALLGAEERTEWQEAELSVRRMHFVRKPELIPDAALQRLLQLLEGEVARYIDELPAAAHPALRWVPRTFTLHPWAVISRGDGYNVPHTHSRGWLSGVFYVSWQGERDGHGGMLRITRPSAVPPEAPGWPDLLIPPVPGTLVLMPSYFTHSTVPLPGPGLRVAVAFDVIDARDESEPVEGHL